MKIQPQHYQFLKTACLNTLERKPGIEQAYKNAGLTHKRFRWDVAYGSGLSGFICQHIYTYANDEHVDTALRNILGSEYK